MPEALALKDEIKALYSNIKNVLSNAAGFYKSYFIKRCLKKSMMKTNYSGVRGTGRPISWRRIY